MIKPLPRAAKKIQNEQKGWNSKQVCEIHFTFTTQSTTYPSTKLQLQAHIAPCYPPQFNFSWWVQALLANQPKKKEKFEHTTTSNNNNNINNIKQQRQQQIQLWQQKTLDRFHIRTSIPRHERCEEEKLVAEELGCNNLTTISQTPLLDEQHQQQ